MDQPTFQAPGPGRWELDHSHASGGATPIYQWLMRETFPVAFRRLFRELGVAADTMDMAFVHGFSYTRLRPLFGADRQATKAPPPAVLKLVGRLHPELRRRERAAAETLRERPWRTVIARWHAELRPRLEADNLAFQDVDVATLDDGALAEHVEALLRHARQSCEQHFYLHGFDLGPLGLLIHEANDWGLATAEVLPALAGASPSTSAPREALCRIRDAVAEAGATPTSLDELRAVSPTVAEAVDRYVRFRGHVLYTRYDLDGRTLLETPDVLLATILHARGAGEGSPDPAEIASSLRQRVPVDQRGRFDELLAEARAAMDLRDDNGPNTVEWPLGLLRRGLLEAGRRLVAADRLAAPEHALELEPAEVAPLLRDGEGPSADEVASRAARRLRDKALDPPATLGPPQPEPPLDALPPNLGRMVKMVQCVTRELGIAERDGAAQVDSMDGAGVGDAAYRGRARVALSPEDAIASLEPGDVLVTRTTSPAFNLVLTLVGGLVTTEGGPMSHAAVLARELGFPAVIGAPGALAIPDGSLVEVDPVAGRVRVVDTAGEAPVPAPA